MAIYDTAGGAAVEGHCLLRPVGGDAGTLGLAPDTRFRKSLGAAAVADFVAIAAAIVGLRWARTAAAGTATRPRPDFHPAVPALLAWRATRWPLRQSVEIILHGK